MAPSGTREKRTKPCSNCKKSKVKCIYTSELPCERCVKMGQSLHCQFVPKLPSLSLPLLSPQIQESPVNNVSRAPSVFQLQPQPQQHHPRHHPLPSSVGPILPLHTPRQPNIPSIRNPVDFSNHPRDPSREMWKDNMENRINSFDNKLNDLVDILKSNQQLLLDSQQRFATLPYQTVDQNGIPIQVVGGNGSNVSALATPPLGHYQNPHRGIPTFSSLPNSRPMSPYPEVRQDSPLKLDYKMDESSRKRTRIDDREEGGVIKVQKAYPTDFRDGYLELSEAKILFEFFDANISQQLFGFELSKYSVADLWNESPVLICAICTISSIHHPSKHLSEKLNQLKKYLQTLCSNLLYQGRPKTEMEGFHAIVALVLCSFWLSDSQMFTGLALQLAKEIGLNTRKVSTERNGLKNKDRVKLWYLLYVLDGQQSLTFNRQPLVASNEPSFLNAREILGTDQKTLETSSEIEREEKKKLIGNNENKYNESKSSYHEERFNDMRLVSQVEYNQALNEAFSGNAWDLLAPSSFGIPSKTNLQLDKWMVSWTVLLAPVTNGAVWSSKSTLIYYNFAKMHINSTAVRSLQMQPHGDERLPKWDKIPTVSNVPPSPRKIEKISENSDSDSSDDEEFISNKDYVSEDETVISAGIAASAAQTVLNLVVNDKDILNNLKYVPVHIHIMLYYAALLMINPPLVSNNKSESPNKKTYFKKMITNLQLVKKLQKKIYLNLPTDKQFGDRLIKSINELLEEKTTNLKEELTSKDCIEEFDKGTREKFLGELNNLESQDLSDNIIELSDVELARRSSGESPGTEKIYAWPGSNHGHP